MKNRYLLQLFAIGMFFAISLASCAKDNESPPPTTHNGCLTGNKITISNITHIPATVTFNSVKAEITGFNWQVITTIEAAYSKGEIVLSLPATFKDEELQKVTRNNASDYSGFWPATSSNADARVAGIQSIVAYNNGKQVGRIFLTDWTSEGYQPERSYVYYQYADRPFMLISSVISPYNTFIGSFAKGWNAYANVNKTTGAGGEGKVLCTTSIAVTTPLAWRFETWAH